MTDNNTTETTTPPTFDIPGHADIVLSGDTQDLARNMTQLERDALLIQTYRMVQEVVGFVRQAEAALAGMQQAPGMAGMMMRTMMPGMGGANGDTSG